MCRFFITSFSSDIFIGQAFQICRINAGDTRQYLQNW
jgi:hypothetical protein